MDLLMVFLALCLIAWLRGKLSARDLSYGQCAAALVRRPHLLTQTRAVSARLPGYGVSRADEAGAGCPR